MKVKEESEKAGLKLNIQKLRSWHPFPSLHGKKMGKQCKQWQTIFLGSRITADGDYSYETKRHSLLGRKPITNLNSVLKSRDITLPAKVHLVKAIVFPVVMYGCESWAIKAEHRRIDAFELWCWRRLLRVPWTARKSTLNINWKDQFWSWSSNTSGPPDAKSQLIRKDPDADKEWRQEEKETTEYEMVRWHHQLSGHEFEQAPGGGDRQGSLACCSP